MLNYGTVFRHRFIMKYHETSAKSLGQGCIRTPDNDRRRGGPPPPPGPRPCATPPPPHGPPSIASPWTQVS